METKENIYDTLVWGHERVGNSGRQKTWAELKGNYARTKHNGVQLFLQTCPSCTQRLPTKYPPAGRPIISLGLMQKIQMDLIDFSSRADQDFKYILHVRDHFSKLSWAFLLKSKCAAEVATHLSKVFCMFGPARILQSDNGQEINAKVITELYNKFGQAW